MFSKEEVGNYKQETLVNKLLGIMYPAHDASEDVNALCELFKLKLLDSCCNGDISQHQVIL